MHIPTFLIWLKVHVLPFLKDYGTPFLAVFGFVWGVIKFNTTRRIEAQKPFLELRQKLYLETIQLIAILTNPGDHSEGEKLTALRRFRELYVAELSMVESRKVEAGMRAFAEIIAPDLIQLNDSQVAAYKLAHAIRDSFLDSWKTK